MKAKMKPERHDVKYDEVEDLYAVLQEIERNATEAGNLVATRPGKKLRLSAELVDNLRCIVEDAAEHLAPHFDALDEHWENRPKPGTRAAKK